jgi:CRISPR system Cascade subunit CasE
LDRLENKLYLLLLSEDRPDLSVISSQFGPLSGVEAAATKEYDQLLQRIMQDSIWRFRLTANPTRSCAQKDGIGSRGKVHAHCTVAYQQQWLLERAEKHGFSLGEEAFTVTDCRWLHFKKGKESGRPVSLLSVTYEGVLQVTDPVRFRDLLINGIGRGKAYGLGLMTVIRER